MCSFKMNGISITPFMKRFDWYCRVHTTSIILEAFSLHWFLPIHTLFKKKKRDREKEREKQKTSLSINIVGGFDSGLLLRIYNFCKIHICIA